MCHVLFLRVTWLVHMCDMSRSYVWHYRFTRVTCLVFACDMTHSYLAWFIHMCHVLFLRVTWLVHMCDMTHSYVWHNAFKSVTGLIREIWLFDVFEMTHLQQIRTHSHKKRLIREIWFFDVFRRLIYEKKMDSFTKRNDSFVRYDSLICLKRRIYTCGMAHAYMWHDVFICVTQDSFMCTWHDSWRSEGFCDRNVTCHAYE